MSAYKGHRGPNVSQYIANLNTLSPPQQPDLLSEAPAVPEDFSAFLNTDFFDVNGGTNVDLQSPIDFDVDFDTQQAGQPTAAKKMRASVSSANVEPNMDFNLTDDFQFTDFNNFGTAPILDPSMQSLSQPQSDHYPLPPNFSSASALSPDFDQFTSKKRKLDDIVPGTPQALDESARGAAEEDKRRRNTAASARFRVKKKQREQALEKSAKEMSDRVTAMEARIQQLETENTWLKGLITEKNGGKSSTSELRALISKREEGASGRSSSNRTDGVGTEDASPKAAA
ncbi:hypothetical protein P153DRAFT_398614 [Dothidotthia symphoricarpi CBS 119687]|uniref:BZIP domain-containing protein n=1 Tax=Dothidotthia symphoricarpi CBS 119687 TaxID=1392245 RepID=A0A6A6A604_9PLEO|nr:uncharacterized protein P153DRAFT_398614 [Dothidotthia symphoricarpi CBS 119687]KAF2127260.1 hypothetical protein P153DRAFT_398614 [Dothidotthia symphoricarpi CBS 119687]